MCRLDVNCLDFFQRELGVTWDVDLYGELLKIGGGKERYIKFKHYLDFP